MARSKLRQWNDRDSSVALTDVSGKELKRCDPERHQAIVRGIKEGMPGHLLAKVFKISEHMVQGITRTEGIEQDKIRTLADKFEMAAHLGMELYIDKLINKPEELNLDRIPVNAAIAVDKSHQLRSQSQARSAQVKQEQTMEALNDIVKAAIDKAGKRTQVIEAEVIEEKDSQA